MAPIKLKYVVSFSSQDDNHRVANLLEDGASAKRWLSNPQDRSGQVEVVFQLEHACHLAYVDIGVIWCSSIEVRVGKSDWPQGQRYATLVPTQVVMTAIDSRVGRGTMRTCMFSKSVFTQEGQNGRWDRIQIICRQPWRKDVQLGLSFLRVRSTDSHADGVKTASPKLATANSENEARKSVREIQRHFFGKTDSGKSNEDHALKARLQKLVASGEGGSDHEKGLPRIARMVLAANQNSKGPKTPERKDAGCNLYSSSIDQKNAPQFHKEVLQFLATLHIKKEDLDSVCVSDIRHKFEKTKWRKLSADEKRVFYYCCQDFIGALFDEHKTPCKSTGAGKSSNAASSPVSSVASSVKRDALTDMKSNSTPCKNSLPPSLKNKLLNSKIRNPSPSALGSSVSPVGRSPSSSVTPSKLPATKSTPGKVYVGVSTPERSTSGVVPSKISSIGKRPHVDSAAKTSLMMKNTADTRATVSPLTTCSKGSSVLAVPANQAPNSGWRQQKKAAHTSDEVTVAQTASVTCDTDVPTPPKKQKSSASTDTADGDLVKIVDQAISSVEGWLTSGRGAGGHSTARGAGRQRRGRRGRKSLPTVDLAVDDDTLLAADLPDLDLPYSTASTGRGTPAGRKRGGGRRRGTGTRGRGRRAASPLQSSGTSQPSSSESWDSTFDPASGSTRAGHSGGQSDQFDEFMIDEDAVFVECPLCLQMFPSDTITLHASLCCT